jgi:hypothetical protein
MPATRTASIRFERAVFTSVGSHSVRGYHLVARSAGIDDDVAQTLCQWSPAHDGMCDPKTSAHSLNYFLIDEDRFALSKSVIGGAEYSGRGALQTVTTILVGERRHLSLYANNPLTMARVALSMGWLRLISDFEAPLDHVELSAVGWPEIRRVTSEAALADRAAQALIAGNRLAITQDAVPLQTLARVFERLPADLRLKTSFSTGIKPSAFRPFQIQFLSHVDSRVGDFLNRQRIRTLCAASAQLSYAHQGR